MNNTLTYSNFVLENRGSDKNILIKPCVKEPRSLDHGVFYMRMPIEYNRGEEINGVIYLEDAGWKQNKDGTRLRLGLFKCAKCKNGNEFIAIIQHVKRGNTLSCGCLAKKNAVKHGLSYDPLHILWTQIIARCYNPTSGAYYKYGAKGITVCDEWRNDYDAFKNHVVLLDNYGEHGYSLDREENNGNYDPDNVRWITKSQQQANRGKHSNNTSGFTGIYKHQNLWYARITVDKEDIPLGSSTDINDAVNYRNEYIIKNNLESYYKVQQTKNNSSL